MHDIGDPLGDVPRHHHFHQRDLVASRDTAHLETRVQEMRCRTSTFDDDHIFIEAANIEVTSLPVETEPEAARPEAPTRALSMFQLIKSLGVDGATILATALIVNTAVNAPVGTSVSGVN
ncbi:hypothetical protein SODALDRAFT_379613 [Sodiomyces alkalinus F11]|uniref:Uncharacterized protein n=1 Tax=Sodiomyces alkalinus (strain CBS 110278 / VKM F-3762 / F11) TaxID=1314773 RepID=A0A3N2PRK5_SODAK|nr:hypothetical protein SODALDRAFT_379613 [Sodiomyces alkalinus F11]ROT37127.1 hypothetical protein SODALDRAFT_379613 [Sodiomyces alkalinus F11]